MAHDLFFVAALYMASQYIDSPALPSWAPYLLWPLYWWCQVRRRTGQSLYTPVTKERESVKEGEREKTDDHCTGSLFIFAQPFPMIAMWIVREFITQWTLLILQRLKKQRDVRKRRRRVKG